APLTDDLVGLPLFLVGPLEGAWVMLPQPFAQQFPALLACRHVLDKRGYQPLLPRGESGQRGELVQRITLRPPWWEHFLLQNSYHLCLAELALLQLRNGAVERLQAGAIQGGKLLQPGLNVLGARQEVTQPNNEAKPYDSYQHAPPLPPAATDEGKRRRQ